MTLINAIQELINRGATTFDGRTFAELLEWAQENDKTAARVLETGNGDTKWAQYHFEYADANKIIETNGHLIIATEYEGMNGNAFWMATYGDYETEAELYADFDAWKIATEAEEIADKMEKERPGEFPRAAWILIATAELKAAYKAAEIAFNREFHPQTI
jgi:hypothetical protein